MNVYFDSERKKLALEELYNIHECAEKAGMRHALFIGFGLLLGIVREGDFIGHDNDMDMCIRADLIEPKQELEYYRRLKEAGLFFARRRQSFRNVKSGFRRGEILSSMGDDPSDPDTRFAWFSLRKRKDFCKCCNWFFFPWNGYFWHTKGNMWISQRKFSRDKFHYSVDDDAIMKGIPEECITGLTEIKFKGLPVRIPKMFGSCLDFWYPGWRIPKQGGSSAKAITCNVGNWLDKRTWSVHIN